MTASNIIPFPSSFTLKASRLGFYSNSRHFVSETCLFLFCFLDVVLFQSLSDENLMHRPSNWLEVSNKWFFIPI